MSTKREEMLRKKAEDEARKAGTLPPEKDEHGQAINPHIPEFMSKVPWYAQKAGSSATAGLDHQRLPENKKDHSDIGQGWYDRGKVAVTPANTHYVPGACTNCGATTHTAGNCLARPRKQGASLTGSRLAPDDVSLPDLRLSYDGKRDKYNGFSAEIQLEGIHQRNLLKMQQQVNATANPSASSEPKATLPQTSLRLRTDTAKYLRNLDPESAFYDPKTRSMRANPTPHLSSDDVNFAGDNFMKNSGEAHALDRLEAFASLRTQSSTTVSNPTAIALQQKESREVAKVRDAEAMRQRKEVEATYASPLASPPLLATSSSAYVEYTPEGRVVNVEDGVAPSSRFDEDVWEGNHRSVWGSYLDAPSLAWGFACCCQTVRNSYCIGERGKDAVREAKAKLEAVRAPRSAPPLVALATAEPEQKKNKAKKVRVDNNDALSVKSDSSSDWNSSGSEGKKKKKKKSHKHKKHKKSKKTREERKESNEEVKEQRHQEFQFQQHEDEEALRLARIRPGDPMAGT